MTNHAWAENGPLSIKKVRAMYIAQQVTNFGRFIFVCILAFLIIPAQKPLSDNAKENSLLYVYCADNEHHLSFPSLTTVYDFSKVGSGYFYRFMNHAQIDKFYNNERVHKNEYNIRMISFKNNNKNISIAYEARYKSNQNDGWRAELFYDFAQKSARLLLNGLDGKFIAEHVGRNCRLATMHDYRCANIRKLYGVRKALRSKLFKYLMTCVTNYSLDQFLVLEKVNGEFLRIDAPQEIRTEWNVNHFDSFYENEVKKKYRVTDFR